MTAELDKAKRLMLDRHLRARGISDPRVLDAMARVPRERFVGPALCGEAYADRALPIDCDQTISQPYIVALMTQALELRGDERVLEIGTGSGYQTAVLAELALEVISIERHESLSRQAGEILSELGYRNVTLLVGDGTQGWPAAAPVDRVLVAAAAASVIPVGSREHQMLQAIHKLAAGPAVANLSSCRFVPLIGR